MKLEDRAFCTLCRGLPAAQFFLIHRALRLGQSWAELLSQWSERFSCLQSVTRAEVADRVCEIKHWERQGFRLVMPGDCEFPQAFYHLNRPVRFFFVFGEPIGNDAKVSVVGSREPSGLSLAWVEKEIGAFLEENPVCVVSGGARGVDQAVHRAAIERGRRTLVLLPSGVGALYPPDLANWVRPVLQNGGAFVSEYLPHFQVSRFHFAERNRLIAAVSVATLIIEARIRSGTLLTAKSAIEQGKPLWVLPSHPYDFNSRGGLELLLEGASPVRDALDLGVYFRAEILSLGGMMQSSSCVGLEKSLAVDANAPSDLQI